MSTVVCQGLQSCLESQLVETTMLRLKLVAAKSIGLGRGPSMLDNDTKEITEKFHNEGTNKMAIHGGDHKKFSNLELGGWSFLHSLSNISQIPKNSMDIESSYVHPLAKGSSLPKLNEKSLELCTESLGSETGSDTSETSIFSTFTSDSSGGTSPTREQHNLDQHVVSKKVNSRNFPPPLTTIIGSNSLQVRPHREGGRLIIEAMEAPSTHTCFQAERSHGRLRLSFLKNRDSSAEPKGTTQENEEEEEEEREEFENDATKEENQEDDEEEDEEENDVYMKKDMDGNSFDAEVEMEMEKFQRPSRCKEGGHNGNKVLCKWEPFWVATS